LEGSLPGMSLLRVKHSSKLSAASKVTGELLTTATLIEALWSARNEYASVCERLKVQGGPDPEFDTDAVYKEFYRDWRGFKRLDKHEVRVWEARKKNIPLQQHEFNATVKALVDLKSRMDQFLSYLSLESELNERLYQRYRDLFFIKQWDVFVSSYPFQTIRHLDELIELFRHAWPDRHVSAVPDVSAGASPQKRRRKEPHPDPESVLKFNPGGVVTRTAADLLGVGLRRVQELVTEGNLEATGKGNCRRVTVESLRRRLGPAKSQLPTPDLQPKK
jgi:hypothetical protein